MKAIEDFEKIWGVGPEKAKQLYDSGYHDIAALKKDNGAALTSM